jgi:hypothetical protein
MGPWDWQKMMMDKRRRRRDVTKAGPELLVNSKSVDMSARFI